MTFFLVAALGLVALGATTGVMLGLLTRRRSAPVRLVVHLMLIAASLVPVAVHVRMAAWTAATFGEPAIDPIGMVPELESAIITTFVILSALFAVGALVSRVVPVFTAAIPAAAFTLYYVLVLPRFSELPVLVPLDNRPLAWLFAYQSGFMILLAAHAITGRLSNRRRYQPLTGAGRS